jgi:hypothetical protein
MHHISGGGMNPRGCQDQLLVEELPGELLVYDLVRNKAHCLNQTAAFIWQHCDGATTVAEIAARLPEELGLPADETLVWLALDRLGQAGLLQDQPTPPAGQKLLGRRDLMRKLALTGSLAMLLPLISTANIPAAAAAASNPCKPPNCNCPNDSARGSCCAGISDDLKIKNCCGGIRVAAKCKICCDAISDATTKATCKKNCVAES